VVIWVITQRLVVITYRHVLVDKKLLLTVQFPRITLLSSTLQHKPEIMHNGKAVCKHRHSVASLFPKVIMQHYLLL